MKNFYKKDNGFQKLTKLSNLNSPDGYNLLKDFKGSFRGYELTSIQLNDADKIMEWRNEQIDALRQSTPLTPIEQRIF